MRRSREGTVFNLWRKLGEMNLAGRKRAAKGEAAVMPAIPDDWKTVPGSALLFDRASENEFIDRVLKPVQKAAEECGIEMLYATEDFPLHLSLKYGKFPPGKEKNEEWIKKAGEVCADSGLQGRARHLEEELSKTPFNFPFVIFDDGAGSVMLTAVEIPPAIQEFREYAERLFIEKGFDIRNPDPIAHSAFARIKKLPEDPMKLKEFAERIVKIRHDISLSGKPISLRADKVFIGQNMVRVAPLRAEDTTEEDLRARGNAKVKIGRHHYTPGFGSREGSVEPVSPKETPRRRASEAILEKLRNNVEGTPDVLLVLTGPSEYNEKKGKYVTSSYNTGDENSKQALGVSLPTGSRDRVLATAEMHFAFPEAFIVAMTKPKNAPGPTYADLIAQELAEMGVDENKILLEKFSVDTITEYKEAAKLWKKFGWQNMVFVLAEWHVPRATALFNHIEDFAINDVERELLKEFANAIRDGSLAVQFLDTTKVLSTRSRQYKRFFDKELANDPGMQARIESEKGTMAQIAGGTYGRGENERKLTHKIWADKV